MQSPYDSHEVDLIVDELDNVLKPCWDTIMHVIADPFAPLAQRIAYATYELRQEHGDLDVDEAEENLAWVKTQLAEAILDRDAFYNTSILLTKDDPIAHVRTWWEYEGYEDLVVMLDELVDALGDAFTNALEREAQREADGAGFYGSYGWELIQEWGQQRGVA